MHPKHDDMWTNLKLLKCKISITNAMNVCLLVNIDYDLDQNNTYKTLGWSLQKDFLLSFHIASFSH